MSKDIHNFEIEWGGRPLKVELGRIAKQADGSCVVTYGETTVLSTVVLGAPRDVDFFPLTVEFEEKLYAAGKIKGSRFIKREGRATDEAVLSARVVDRGIRPLFNKKMRNDVQLVCTVLSMDGENDPDVPAIVGASIALATSNIPWDGPIGGVRVGQVDGKWILNPSYDEQVESTLDVTISGTPDKILMLEAGAKEIDEKTINDAILFGQKQLTPVMKLIEEIVKKVGKEKLSIDGLSEEDPETLVEKQEIIQKTKTFLAEHLDEYLFSKLPKGSKSSRKQAKEDLKDRLVEYLKSEQIGRDKRKWALGVFDDIVETRVSEAILKEGKRVDGRAITEIRPLFSEVSYLPRVHGSGLFSRGETQVLSIVTLGSPGDEQILDTMEEADTKKRFMHHYNFPPYSVGDTKPMRGPSRRDIGHGALAEKALIPVIPSKEDFPYTIRVVSEVMGSNGSSSMGSTCGSTLALMDAGVPIKKPVAGIAMGLASDEEMKNFTVITDLQDMEDNKGGMDFKIAGTRDGITAIQMDTKTAGITKEVVEKTLFQAKEARLEILNVMEKAIPEPRKDLSPYAPRIETIHINPDKIRKVIGSGGKIINDIIDKTGVQIDIEQDGSVFITSVSAEGMDKAKEMINAIIEEPEVGKIYRGKVVRLMNFGAFVEILPGKDGMVHVSELAPFRVEKVEDVIKLGDEIPVIVTEIDDQGRVNLSLKKAREKLGEPQAEQKPESDNGGDFESRPPRRDDRRDRKPRRDGRR
ncbi:MAG: polyribonucleotide nucleotidyltransferase [Parcubacteria group bacterium CG10_big_fil_rev_8_21_14_0_10_36_14]|nr:MAG: polyribonucleotide nucleotidyltransferase [Parcubacteria group bacterium CG10_big_fil_rev_8_21_14_0_10_36_14]